MTRGNADYLPGGPFDGSSQVAASSCDGEQRPPDAHAQPCTTVDDPDMFFPGGRDPIFAEPALALCRRCAVVRECLAYALLQDVSGVWGGTTERQRQALRERHNIVAQPVSLDWFFEETA